MTKKQTTARVDLSVLADSVYLRLAGAKRTEFAPLPEIAAWLKVGVDALELATRHDRRFEMRTAQKLGEGFARVERPGGKGYWPGLRLRPADELRAQEAHHQRVHDSEQLLTLWLAVGGAMPHEDAPFKVAWNEEEGRFEVEGLDPEGVIKHAYSWPGVRAQEERERAG